MMDDGWLIVCGVLALVVMINVGLALSALRGQNRGQAAALDRSVRYLRDPWADETRSLSELHQRVAELEEADDKPTPGG